nr:uncharacterized protein C2orf42 homolog isoform X1 [Anser cygnoides]
MSPLRHLQRHAGAELQEQDLRHRLPLRHAQAARRRRRQAHHGLRVAGLLGAPAGPGAGLPVFRGARGFGDGHPDGGRPRGDAAGHGALLRAGLPESGRARRGGEPVPARQAGPELPNGSHATHPKKLRPQLHAGLARNQANHLAAGRRAHGAAGAARHQERPGGEVQGQPEAQPGLPARLLRPQGERQDAGRAPLRLLLPNPETRQRRRRGEGGGGGGSALRPLLRLPLRLRQRREPGAGVRRVPRLRRRRWSERRRRPPAGLRPRSRRRAGRGGRRQAQEEEKGPGVRDAGERPAAGSGPGERRPEERRREEAARRLLAEKARARCACAAGEPVKAVTSCWTSRRSPCPSKTGWPASPSASTRPCITSSKASPSPWSSTSPRRSSMRCSRGYPAGVPRRGCPTPPQPLSAKTPFPWGPSPSTRGTSPTSCSCRWRSRAASSRTGTGPTSSSSAPRWRWRASPRPTGAWRSSRPSGRWSSKPSSKWETPLPHRRSPPPSSSSGSPTSYLTRASASCASSSSTATTAAASPLPSPSSSRQRWSPRWSSPRSPPSPSPEPLGHRGWRRGRQAGRLAWKRQINPARKGWLPARPPARGCKNKASRSPGAPCSPLHPGKAGGGLKGAAPHL